MRLFGQRAEQTPERLFVRRTGSDGPAIVLVHGLASSSRYWLGNLGVLGSNRRVIMPDLLGFGRSPKPFASSYSPEEHVAWLDRSLRRLAGGPFLLVGHSMGSLIALHYAAAHPDAVSHLALISLPVIGCLPWGHNADGSPGRLHRLMAHTELGARLSDLAIRVAAPVGRHVAPRIQHDVPREAAMDSLSVTSASYWRTLEQVVYGQDPTPLFDRIDAPVMVLHGADDRIVPLGPVRELANVRREVDLRVLERVGHNPWFTHPDAVARLLQDLIRKPRPIVRAAAR